MLEQNKEYINKEIIKFIFPIGYRQRVGNYYIFREKDGYINIHYYRSIPNGFIQPVENIVFFKNFYTGSGKKAIERKFTTLEEFKKFMESYHVIQFRKLKLKKLNKLNNRPHEFSEETENHFRMWFD